MPAAARGDARAVRGAADTCLAMWRVCDAETWIGDGVGDEYSVLSLSKRAFEAPRDVGFLKYSWFHRRSDDRAASAPEAIFRHRSNAIDHATSLARSQTPTRHHDSSRRSSVRSHMSGMPLAGGQSAGVVNAYQYTRVANNRVGVNHWNSAAKASNFSESPTESHSIINNTLLGHVVS